MTSLTLEPAQFVDESDLIDQLRGRDGAAFEQIVRAYGPRMLATANRLLSCNHEAHDAVQEAFLSALKAIDSFNGDAKLSTWLHRIVVNACLMKRRKRVRAGVVSLDEHQPTFDETGHHTVHPRRWPSDAFAAVSADERRIIVRECIGSLPESYRQVILLRDIEEMDTNEVAEVLGETAGNVKTRLHRARRALRSLLEERLGRDGLN